MARQEAEPIQQSLAQIKGHLDNLSNLHEEISQEICKGNNSQAIIKLNQLLICWQAIVNIINILSPALKLKPEEIKDVLCPMQDSFNNLQLALKNADIVLITDVLNYELKPQVESVKKLLKL